VRSVRCPESPESSAKRRIYEITNRGSNGALVDILIRRWGRLVQSRRTGAESDFDGLARIIYTKSMTLCSSKFRKTTLSLVNPELGLELGHSLNLILIYFPKRGERPTYTAVPLLLSYNIAVLEQHIRNASSLSWCDTSCRYWSPLLMVLPTISDRRGP